MTALLDQTLDCCRRCLRPLVGPSKPCLSCSDPGRLPARIGPYLVRSLLGQGGLGRVYEAHDEALDRSIAIKVFAPSQDADIPVVDRFLREARVLARVSHENVVAIHSIGQAAGTVFCVMEHVRGHSLQAVLLERGRLEARESLLLVREVARGLQAAFARGLVHRDVKPANVLLGANGCVKVADFGLARVMSDPNGLTSSSVVVGTADYMSPEQARGLPIDARSDLYSLGITLFQMLTGELPYRDPSPVNVLIQHVVEPLPDVLERFPELPVAVVTILDKMTAKIPEDRFEGYETLLVAIDEVLESLAADERARLEDDTVRTCPDAGPDAGASGADDASADVIATGAPVTSEALLLGSIRDGARPMLGLLLGSGIAIALGIATFLIQEPLLRAQAAAHPKALGPLLAQRESLPAVDVVDATTTVTATGTTSVPGLTRSSAAESSRPLTTPAALTSPVTESYEEIPAPFAGVIHAAEGSASASATATAAESDVTTPGGYVLSRVREIEVPVAGVFDSSGTRALAAEGPGGSSPGAHPRASDDPAAGAVVVAAMATAGAAVATRQTLSYVFGSEEAAQHLRLEPGRPGSGPGPGPGSGSGARGAVRREGGRLLVSTGGPFTATHGARFAGDVSAALDLVLRPGAEASIVLKGRSPGAVVSAVFRAAGVEGATPLRSSPSSSSDSGSGGVPAIRLDAGARLMTGVPPAAVASGGALLKASVPHRVEIARAGEEVRVRVDGSEVFRFAGATLAADGDYEVGIVAPAGGVELRTLRIMPEHVLSH